MMTDNKFPTAEQIAKGEFIPIEQADKDIAEEVVGNWCVKGDKRKTRQLMAEAVAVARQRFAEGAEAGRTATVEALTATDFIEAVEALKIAENTLKIDSKRMRREGMTALRADITLLSVQAALKKLGAYDEPE